MDKEFVIPDYLIKYILFQRTGLIKYANFKPFTIWNKYSPWSFYEKMVAWEASFRKGSIVQLFQEELFEDYQHIKDFLPERCNAILDIGCGIAAIDILLFRHYQSDETFHLYLFDKSKIEKRVFYNYKEKGAFYNSLQIARNFLVENGLCEESIHLLEVPESGHIEIPQRPDLVISLISWGFHYPVSTYLGQVYDLLKDGGRLILDVRRDTEGEQEIRSLFKSVVNIAEHQKSKRLLAIK